MLVTANTLIGAEAMNAAIQAIAAEPRQYRGQDLLDILMSHTPENRKAQLEALFNARIDHSR